MSCWLSSLLVSLTGPQENDPLRIYFKLLIYYFVLLLLRNCTNTLFDRYQTKEEEKIDLTSW